MKKKLKKYNSGVTYISPEYNTESQQVKTGKYKGAASSITNMGAGLAGVAGEGLTNSALQPTYNNSEKGVSSGKLASGQALKYGAMGATAGSAFGPIGTLVGFGVGAIGGGIAGTLQAKNINATAANNKRVNDFMKKQNSYSAQEIDQIGYAKKGLDMTKKKGLKKFPGGTSSVAKPDPNLPRFTAAENEQLIPLRGTPQYKQAMHNAMGYVPKYPNPVAGSKNAMYEDSVYNQRVKTFNSRDLTKQPANFGNAMQNFDANTQTNNLNYTAQNAKLDSFVANQGGVLPNNLSIPNVPGQMPNSMKKVPPYAGGTKAIKGAGKLPSESQIQMTPAERSSLPPVGTPEHRQAIWDLLGYAPKTYPAGSQGYANQEKHFNSALSLINDGYRPTVSPSGNKGYSKMYEDGTKKVKTTPPKSGFVQKLRPTEFNLLPGEIQNVVVPNQQIFQNQQGGMVRSSSAPLLPPPLYHPTPIIPPNSLSLPNSKFTRARGVYNKGSKKIEVEGDEIHLAKKGSKFVVKNDFKDGPTHAEGGIEIVAQEGDIITPANKRGQVVEALQEGNHKKLESIRKSLPKDKPAYKMKKGGTVKKDTRDKSEPVSATPKDFKPFSSGYTQTGLKKINSVKTGNPKASTSSNFDASRIGEVAGTLGEIAPIAYNIGQGLFGKVQKTNRRNVTPSNFQYQDNSQPLRNEINSLYNQDKQTIRNASGGNAGTYLANTGMASANKFKRLQEVNNTEAARKVQTQNANTELQNNAQSMNVQLNNQYDEMDLGNSARKGDFLATGLGQASQFAQNRVLQGNLKNRDEMILNNLETPNYKVGKDYKIQKKKNGTSGVKAKYKMKKA